MELAQNQKNADNKKIVGTPGLGGDFADIDPGGSCSLSKDCKASYIQATIHFVRDEFILAKKEFVKVIRPVLSKSMMKSLDIDLKDVLLQTLDSMYHLGLIYLNNPDGSFDNNYVKAASIFQYCAQFRKKHDISLELDGQIANEEYFINKAFEVEQQFLSNLGLMNLGNAAASGVSPEGQSSLLQQSKDKINSYKAELVSLRATTKAQLRDIENLTIEDIKKRSEAVEQIYANSSEFFVNHKTQQGLLQRLIADCRKQLGNPPEGCDHSIIGLGSLSLGTMTPWSDLEFAVLLNENKPEYKEYFRNLTKLLWIKVINFGETPLSAVGVESLNNYKTGDETDNWFSDDVIEKAFRFDPVYEDACKSALGRQGNYKVIKKIKDKDTGIETGEILTIEKPDYELILTPEEMLNFQLPGEIANKSLNWFETDRHLVQTLQSVALIEGSQKLLDKYRQDLNQKTDRALQQDRALQILQEDVDKFSLKLGDEEEGKLLDVKQNIYRLGDRIVNALANYHNITAAPGESHITVWQMIDRMQDKAVLNEKSSQYLKTAVSIATELRMRTYSENQGRYDNMSTYIPAVDHLNEEQRKALIEKTFHIKDTSMLHHFYHVMIVMQEMARIYSDKSAGIFDKLSCMLDPNQSKNNGYYYFKGMICSRFLEYAEALKYLEKANEEKPDDLEILERISSLYDKTGKIDRELKIAETLVDLYTKKYPHNLNHPDIANSYNDLGEAKRKKGEYDEAIKAYNKALEIYSVVYKTPHHLEIAKVYTNLGSVYTEIGEYDDAIQEYDKALKIYSAVYKTSNHLNIAKAHNNRGGLHLKQGEYAKAIVEFTHALEIFSKVYAKTPNHYRVAECYNNLGEANREIGAQNEAIHCFEQALKIWQKVYESMPNHSNIAVCYSNLGNAYVDEPDKAIEYHNKAFEIRCKDKSISNHPHMAASYNNLGNIFYKKGECDDAIKEYNKALKIYLTIYKSNPDHPEIARIHNNLGAAYLKQGLYTNAKNEFENAKNEFEKALQIIEKAYKSIPHHRDIAYIHNNLGNIYLNECSYNKAITEFEKALEIFCEVYKDKPHHPHIATSYSNLGNAYTDKGLYYQGITKFHKALEIWLKVYENTPNHPRIVMSYNNLESAYNTAYTKLPHSMVSKFYSEYAQFLILNKSNLVAQYNDIDKRITDLLYKATETDGSTTLEYGIASLHTVVPILKTIIVRDSTKTINISPKILSYHLLITNPEYIKENDNIIGKFLNFVKNNEYVKHDKLFLEMMDNAYAYLDKYKEFEGRTAPDNIATKETVPNSAPQLSGESDNTEITD